MYLLLSKDLCCEHSKRLIPASPVLSIPFSFIWDFLVIQNQSQKIGRIERCGQLQQLYIRCPNQLSQQTWCNLNSLGLLCKCAHISVTLSTYNGLLPRRWDVTIFIPMESSKGISSTVSLCSVLEGQLSSGKTN